MANIVCLKEKGTRERRCALLPANVKSYVLLGTDVIVESGLGENVFITDEEYANAGATVLSNRAEIIAQADVILSVDKLPIEDVILAKGKTVISFLDPFNSHDYVDLLCQH